MEQVDTFKNATTVDKITFDSFEKNDSKRFPLVFKKEAKFINAMLDRPEFTDEQKAKFNTPDEFTNNELIDAWTASGGVFDEHYLRAERLMGGVDQNARVTYITFISAALCAPIMDYLRAALPGVIREIPDSEPCQATQR